ncbi:MAG: ribonuclease J [Candidatus Paceibacterota bacterium]
MDQKTNNTGPQRSGHNSASANQNRTSQSTPNKPSGNGGTQNKRRFNNRPNSSSQRPSGSGLRRRSSGGAPRPRQQGNSNGRKDLTPVPALEKGNIRIIPLGGVEEIGRNMTMVELNDQIIIIDAGIGFADEENPGIDYMIPNTKYLEANKHKIKAMVVTHGHLDHIGGIPYLIERIGNPPIYTREFGALLIKAKAEDFPGLKLNIKVVEGNDGSLPISPDFKVRFFGLTHSIPDSTGVIIETPFGDIVSTGDVRVDNKDGVPLPKEFEQYKMFKDRNILLMTMDSTGITSPGWSGSEAEVINNIDTIIKNAPGRLIIGTFASQVERILEFINSATKYGKYVAVDGRSMKTNVGIAKELKLTDFKNVIGLEEMDDYPPHKIVLIATGAQGEEFAALMRMANGTHKQIKLSSTDTIVLSSSVIPGNESAVDALKDNLYRGDAKVITYMDNVVHASGHGKRGELEWLHKQIDYRFFMPVHGHHHRLKMHVELAESLGLPKGNSVVPDNGSVIEIRNEGKELIKLKEKVPGEAVIIDGLSVSDTQHLSETERLWHKMESL